MLLKYFDPFRLADQAAELSGQLKLTDMTRLSQLLPEPKNAEPKNGIVEVTLKFEKVERQPRIYVKVSTELHLTCQRCLQPMTNKVEIENCLVPIVAASQAPQIAKEFEPLLTEGKPVNLLEMVENELLISIPMFPKHPEGRCDIELPDNISFR